MLHETIDMLDVKPDGIYVDATLGGAGHSEYLLSKLSEKGHLYAFDQDQNAIDNAQKTSGALYRKRNGHLYQGQLPSFAATFCRKQV